MFSELVATLAANGLVFAVLTYLVKSLLGNRFEKDIIEFKATLEGKVSENIEGFRHSMEKERVKLQISYGSIFEKQANAILELYSAVLALERGANEAINLGGEFEQRHLRFIEPWSEL